MSAEAKGRWWLSAVVAVALSHLAWVATIERRIGLASDRLFSYENYPRNWADAKDIVLAEAERRALQHFATENKEMKQAIHGLTEAVNSLKVQIAQMKQP